MNQHIGMLMLALCLAGCSAGGENTPESAATLDDQNSTQDTTTDSQVATAEPLSAPAQPLITVRSTPETLIINWQSQSDKQIASIYSYNASTGLETLIADTLPSTVSTLSLPSNSAMRQWHAEQLRVELCEAGDCVSSERVSLIGLAAASMNIIRPAVYLQGERFADVISVNDDASILVASRPSEKSIQIFLHNQARWVATQPVYIDASYDPVIVDIVSSASGDTLAVLVKSNAGQKKASSIHFAVRLGEAWFAVEQILLPSDLDIDRLSSLQLSADAKRLLVNAGNNIISYEQIDQQWRQYDDLESLAQSELVVSAANRGFDYLHVIERENQQLWLVSHTRMQGGNTLVWQPFHRSLIQGLNANDDVMLHSSIDGQALIVAGWENTQTQQRTPVAWRYSINLAPDGSQGSTVSVRDSLRSTPTSDDQARLRFAASDDLDQLVLGWQSDSADDARIFTHTFSTELQQWHIALELPADSSINAKQGFAHDMALSADGQTLLMSTLPGNASLVDNRAGQLLVIR